MFGIMTSIYKGIKNNVLFCVLIVCPLFLILVTGEYWKASIQNGVRCVEVSERSNVSSKIQCLRTCLDSVNCCSVNYNDDLNTCEFCTAGPTIMMVEDESYKYIGYTEHQESFGDPSVSIQSPCHMCTEVFNNTVNGNVKSLRHAQCANDSQMTLDVTKEACFDNKDEFNESVSVLTNGGTCVRWDDPSSAYNAFPNSYFIADGESKTAAQNYCRHPKIKEGSDDEKYNAPYLYCMHTDPYIQRAMCAVRKCDSTSLYKCDTPPSLPSPAIRSYPVIGDVYLALYNCSSFSDHVDTPHCPVSRCIGNNNWTTPSISCSAKDCYPAGNFTAYVGKRTCTESGRTCQAWAVNYPHSNFYPSLQNDPSNENFCRATPDHKPWCYTTDPALRWEICGIPEC